MIKVIAKPEESIEVIGPFFPLFPKKYLRLTCSSSQPKRACAPVELVFLGQSFSVLFFYFGVKVKHGAPRSLMKRFNGFGIL